MIVAEAEKAGIEKAGGKADIYQYVSSLALRLVRFARCLLSIRPCRRALSLCTSLSLPTSSLPPILLSFTRFSSFLSLLSAMAQ